MALQTLLLVEDEALTALATTAQLERMGFQVVHAKNGAAALAALELHPELELVLMDIELGEAMDGVETARLLLARRELPLVYLSRYEESEILSRTKDIPGHGFITKSAGPQVLLSIIHMALRHFEAEKGLKAAAKYTQAIIDSSKDLIWTVDPQRFGLQSWNQAFAQACRDGFCAELVPGIHPIELFNDARIASDWMGYYQMAVQDGHFFLAQAPFGSRRRIELSIQTVRLGASINGLAVFARDITERLAWLEQSGSADRKFRAVFDNSPNIITISAVDDGRFIEVNPAFERILGYQAAEVIGRSSTELRIFVDPEFRAKHLQEYRRRRRLDQIRLELRHKSGAVVQGIGSFIICEIDGLACSISIVADLSSQKDAWSHWR